MPSIRRSARIAQQAVSQIITRSKTRSATVKRGGKKLSGSKTSQSEVSKNVRRKSVVSKKRSSSVNLATAKKYNFHKKNLNPTIVSKKSNEVEKIEKRTKKSIFPLPESLAPKKEKAALKKGFKYVIGVDEAGRGPLAGPVVAAACILPINGGKKLPAGLRDSKELTEPQRDAAYEELVSRKDIFWAVSIVDSERIDEINILQATFEGMTNATTQIKKPKSSSHVLIDGPYVPPALKENKYSAEPVIRGDSVSPSIAAASIIAKVTRDKIMKELDAKFPMYDLGSHKGYGTAHHRAMIAKHGPSEIHRLTFAPIKTMKGYKIKRAKK